jgi:hypothetical protein
VLWNQDDLLNLGFFGYDYSDETHGMYGTYVRNYDRTGACCASTTFPDDARWLSCWTSTCTILYWV